MYDQTLAFFLGGGGVGRGSGELSQWFFFAQITSGVPSPVAVKFITCCVYVFI